MVKYLILFVLLNLALCANGKTKSSDLLPIPSNKGIFAIGEASHLKIVSVEIKHAGDIDTLELDDGYIYTILKPGEYEIVKINLSSRAYFELDNSAIWSFTIKPGKLNYAGHITIQRAELGKFALDLRNRASYFYEHLESNYPYLKSVETIYASHFNDRFFDYMADIK